VVFGAYGVLAGSHHRIAADRSIATGDVIALRTYLHADFPEHLLAVGYKWLQLQQIIP
jgi:hypothetical protein